MRVQLFTTCLIDAFFPETLEAVLRLLRHFGVEAIVPPGQTCCGKPSDSGGYARESRQVAKRFITVFRGNDPILIPSGSCASMVKNHYPELFKDDPCLREKAEAVAARTYELSQFLVHVLRAHEAGLRGRGKITYHASCQLQRELGVREEPLLLLRSLQGAQLVPLPHADRCCGFGGIFMAKLPDLSLAMAEEKAEEIVRSGADTVTGCDHGCLLNIADALRRRGSKVRVRHLAAVLADGLPGKQTE